MRICIVSGHTTSGKGTGAKGYICESTQNRVVAKKVVDYLKKEGHYVVYGEINNSSNYLAEQVAIANKEQFDLVVQIHFNAGGGTGTETLYTSSTGQKYATQITNRLGVLYKQRGAKKRTDLYWLNKTKYPSVLVEVCFVDSKVDTDKYLTNIDYTAKLIAEGIQGKEIVEKPPTQASTALYRVIVGSYSNKDNAQKALQDVKAKGYSSAYIQEVTK